MVYFVQKYRIFYFFMLVCHISCVASLLYKQINTGKTKKRTLYSAVVERKQLQLLKIMSKRK